MNRDWRLIAKQAVRQVQEAATEIQSLSPYQNLLKLALPPGLSVPKVVCALEQFPECVRYLNTRRSSGAVIDINGEADLQDVVFLMLRPWLVDLIPENPTDKIASRYVIKDFLSKELALVVEAKYVRDKKHGKNITKELHDDIETYRNHPDCDNLIFFIYDRDALIPDVRGLRKQIEGTRKYEGKQIAVYCVVKP